MLKYLKNTIFDTAVYSMGSLITKVVGIVLLPVYTTHLSLSEFGQYGLLETTWHLLSIVLSFGLLTGFMRWFTTEKDEFQRKRIFFTTVVFLFSVVVIFNIVVIPFLKTLSGLVLKQEDMSHYIQVSFILAGLDVLTLQMFNLLRVLNRSVFYVLINIARFAFNLLGTIFFVAHMHLGVMGILWGQMCGYGIAWFFLFRPFIQYSKCQFSLSLLGQMLKFSIPMIFVSLSNIVLSTGDRYVLQFMTTDDQVGIYTLAFKIANFINVFVIQSFTLGYLPRTYQIYGKPGDKRRYSKMLTYFTFVLCIAFLFVSFFSRYIIQFFSRQPDYWEAAVYIPLLAFSMIFLGMKYIFSLGLLLKKKTRYLSLFVSLTALLNIGLNMLAVPFWNIWGACLTTLFCYALLTVLIYSVAQKFYTIPFERKKIMLLLAISIGLYGIGTLTDQFSWPVEVSIKCLLMASFPFILTLFHFYEDIEIQRIREFKQKMIKKYFSDSI